MAGSLAGWIVEKQKASGETTMLLAGRGGEGRGRREKNGKCWRHEEELEIGIRNWVEMETNGCNSRTK